MSHIIGVRNQETAANLSLSLSVHLTGYYNSLVIVTCKINTWAKYFVPFTSYILRCTVRSCAHLKNVICDYDNNSSQLICLTVGEICLGDQRDVQISSPTNNLMYLYFLYSSQEHIIHNAKKLAFQSKNKSCKVCAESKRQLQSHLVRLHVKPAN